MIIIHGLSPTPQPGTLSGAVREVRSLVRELLRREDRGASGRNGAREQLEQEAHRALEAVDKLNIEVADLKDKLKAKVGVDGII